MELKNMKLILPKDYLSYSALTLFEKNKADFRKRYYEGLKLPDTKYSRFGREVHEQIDTDPQFADIRLPVAEHKMTVKVEGIPILGYIDTFCPETFNFGEYKSGIRKPDGKPRWTAVDVAKHDQLPFYSLLIQEKYGAKINKTYLVWLETEIKKHTITQGGVEIVLSQEMKLTGYRERFDRKIYQYDRDRIKKWIITSAKQIHDDYEQWRNNGEKQIISKHMAELGRRGAKAKWAKLSPEERSKMMTEYAKRPRPNARKKLSTDE
jgi:hypothetical protein